jgi:hypothetical protein
LRASNGSRHGLACRRGKGKNHTFARAQRMPMLCAAEMPDGITIPFRRSPISEKPSRIQMVSDGRARVFDQLSRAVSLGHRPVFLCRDVSCLLTGTRRVPIFRCTARHARWSAFQVVLRGWLC